jgi:sulfate transport system ATP-binding protein
MAIEVRNVTKTFGSVAAVRHVDLVVPDGELVALLGPSGSGKTTLLRIIAGLEFPDRGTVRFGGQGVDGRPVGQRGVGFVFQHYALFRHMTVFENIAFGLRVRPRRVRPSRSDIRDKVHELLKLIQLEGLESRYPSQLSGGQRQRVALARALAIEPKVLLLDEPFGALDARVRQSLRRWLRKLHEQIHVTSVFVTHDQEEALELADHVVVMNAGRIEQIGPPDEVFHSPANPFVMEFLGNVNLFHGRLEQGKGVFGPLVLDRAAVNGTGDARTARAARLMVRPHELELLDHPNGQPSLEATVLRIQAAGPLVRVELESPGGQFLQAEISHDRSRQLRLAPGQRLFVTPRESKVFVDEANDYSI